MKVVVLGLALSIASAAHAGVYHIREGRLTAQRETIAFEFDARAEQGIITGIEVRLSISHNRTSDLYIGLGGDDGRLFDRMGTGANFQDTLVSSRSNGPILGSAGTDSPYAGPEWGGQSYRSVTGFSSFLGQTASRFFTLMLADVGTDDTGYVYKAGQATPWGTAFGTQLIVHTTVPEPGTWAVLGLGALLFVRRRA